MSDNRVSASIRDSQFHTMTNDRVKETVGVCCCPDVTETLARAISSMFESHIRSLSTILVTQPIDRAVHLSTNNTCYYNSSLKHWFVSSDLRKDFSWAHQPRKQSITYTKLIFCFNNRILCRNWCLKEELYLLLYPHSQFIASKGIREWLLSWLQHREHQRILSKLGRYCCIYHLLACWMSSNKG